MTIQYLSITRKTSREHGITTIAQTQYSWSPESRRITKNARFLLYSCYRGLQIGISEALIFNCWYIEAWSLKIAMICMEQKTGCYTHQKFRKFRYPALRFIDHLLVWSGLSFEARFYFISVNFFKECSVIWTSLPKVKVIAWLQMCVL